MDPTILAQPQVDATDPVFVLVAWAVTWLVGRLSTRYDLAWVRPFLPWVAAVVAVWCRSLYDVVALGEPLTLDTALRAFATGAVAVWGHSVVRGAQKTREVKRPVETVDAA